jgi:hypothetical protein
MTKEELDDKWPYWLGGAVECDPKHFDNIDLICQKIQDFGPPQDFRFGWIRDNTKSGGLLFHYMYTHTKEWEAKEEAWKEAMWTRFGVEGA